MPACAKLCAVATTGENAGVPICLAVRGTLTRVHNVEDFDVVGHDTINYRVVRVCCDLSRTWHTTTS